MKGSAVITGPFLFGLAGFLISNNGCGVTGGVRYLLRALSGARTAHWPRKRCMGGPIVKKGVSSKLGSELGGENIAFNDKNPKRSADDKRQ
jgi:hypothetical protein